MSLRVDLQHAAPPLHFVADVPAGGITALVGPSGSGKTSVLRAIAGLIRARHARISLDGTAWADSTTGLHLPTRRRPIGFVPQQYGLFPHLTAQQNVEAALLHLGRAERHARARECLALAHVAGLEGRLPHELSGGQRQRVALARAIARAPKLLLLDEPFSGVDRSTRKRLYVELRRLHEHLGTTVLLVTHDLDEAAQLASQLILLRHGRSLQAGPIADVLTRPRSEEAARLLDIPNIFTASTSSDAAGRTLLHWGPYALMLGASPVVDGREMKFAVLPQDVLVVHADKPRGAHLENPLPVEVEDLVTLGAETLVWFRPAGVADRLQARLPTRAVQRTALAVGKHVTVCLRSADLIPLAE